MEYISKTEKDTFQFAYSLAEKVIPGDIFLLEGELGAGKSIFVRGIAKGLGVNEAMPSPTFTLVNEYSAKLPVYHFDFYRLSDPFELFEIGFEEYIYSNGVSFIEWPSKGGDLIPQKSIKVKIDILNDKRRITVTWKR